MCCEATDALLEYIRRSLNLTGLRNLNAPRRLKLRVPVLKEWLLRQGHSQLASSIPDWDPVRKPTGRWKAWEINYLKPIMDEKAAERQAKRNLLAGDTSSAGDIMGGMIQQRHEMAIEGLKALSHGAQQEASSGASAVDVKVGDGVEESQQPLLTMQCATSEPNASDSGGEEAPTFQSKRASRLACDAADAVARALAMAEELGEVLALLEPRSESETSAVQSAVGTLGQLKEDLNNPALSDCSLREMNPTHTVQLSSSQGSESLVGISQLSATALSQFAEGASMLLTSSQESRESAVAPAPQDAESSQQDHIQDEGELDNPSQMSVTGLLAQAAY